MRNLSGLSLNDPHRCDLAGHRADGHARRYRNRIARVIAVFGAAKPHCVYLFANRRANRMKVLVHDGVGVWLAARRLNQGKFHWPGIRHGSEVELNSEQLQALVLGLPWQRVGAGGVISML
ncbi:IS66 family insertion sequence element accessory protein TnpB [Pseudomonas sp. K1(2024)]|uniref:IS66 family insertion sequence element accessory protein TnpB n=1 Tax=Pseudomonas boreofloridensis TaxID=3064348 RepID=A0ABV4Z3H9_9PSED|nr:IS66 family insertion sequence element accessory protein TnpB [Pseudomonas sp. K13]MDO7900666.1 IS66 family insertion sequence element accessory protein TnpB [Pseudomonas sp. K13]